jgi:PLP dependent protein
VIGNMTDIAHNLRVVRERIEAAARKSGRRIEDVTLVAVTKTRTAEEVEEAIAAGATDVGENYVQEAGDKWSEIGPAVRWHFIGHLQRNKAKNAVEIFDTVQSVDSLQLAEELGKRAGSAAKTLDVLIEVNVGEESTKFGVQTAEVLELAGQVASVDGLRLLGLMGMPPFLADPEEVRPYFAALKDTWDRLPDENRRFLSMGMTHDFEVAIEEGSNMVRIGTAIFGPRL